MCQSCSVPNAGHDEQMKKKCMKVILARLKATIFTGMFFVGVVLLLNFNGVMAQEEVLSITANGQPIVISNEQINTVVEPPNTTIEGVSSTYVKSTLQDWYENQSPDGMFHFSGHTTDEMTQLANTQQTILFSVEAGLPFGLTWLEIALVAGLGIVTAMTVVILRLKREHS